MSRNNNHYWLGKKRSESTKAKIREKRKFQVIHHSEETKRKIGQANSLALKGHVPWNKGKKGVIPAGAMHHNWKGDDAKYEAVHSWIRKIFGQAQSYGCMFCGNTMGSKKFEWANLDGKYIRNLQSWTTLCKKCHTALDDNVNRSWLTRKHGTSGLEKSENK